MAYELPSFYDSTNLVTRPMDTTDQIPPAQVPISAAAGNQIQLNADGIYYGSHAAYGSSVMLYINNSGTDATTSGAKASPYQTIAYALTQAQALFPNNQLTGRVTILLQAGQSFAWNVDLTVYPGASFIVTFYGDTNYGDYNTLVSGTSCYSQYMSDLARPVINPATGTTNGLNSMNGINRAGGLVQLIGVQINLPAAPSNTSILVYSNVSDFVRFNSFAEDGGLNLLGTNVNMTDTNSFWGILGIQSLSTSNVMTQFGTQFLINGLQMSAANNPTTTQLNQRQYFIKFYPGYAGNNQVAGVLSGSAANTSGASGLFNLSWTDTESLTVTGSKVSNPSYPVCFDVTYGFRFYVYGLQRDQQSRSLNVVSSRLF
jgi:hypothetical protein